MKHEELIFSALDALQPAGLVADIITEIDLGLRKLSATQKYNLLHLRTESDWIAHCARWENIGDGVVRDNCMNNTETVGRQLSLHGVDTDVSAAGRLLRMELVVAFQSSCREWHP